MIRRTGVIGLLIAMAALVGVLGTRFMRSRGATASAPAAVQWPFDGGELRTLMNGVLDEQDSIIATADDAETRGRAKQFRDYYQRRTEAATTVH